MSFLISNAYADATTTAANTAAATSSTSGNFVSFLMLIGFIVIFYFLLWRPQAKRQKDHRTLLGNLSKGDEVITSGGLMGTITRITDDFIVLAIADNVEIKVQKSAIANVLPKGTLKSV